MQRRTRFEPLESRLLMASDWQNAFRARDVNNDGFVSPLDALLGINRLNNRAEPSQLPARASDSTEPFFDVNGDNFQTPIDVLIIINSLNGGLLLTANLASDTGSGPDAGRDRLTRDVSIKGGTQSAADYLQVRINGESQWHDVIDLLQANGTFAIPEAKLAQLVGAPLTDGSFTLDIRAGQGAPGSELSERVALSLQRDSVRPQPSFAGEILMTQPDKIVIPLTEAIEPSTFSPSLLRLYDITWGEDTTKTTFTDDGRYPRFELSPRSVTLGSNNREIIVVPPTNTRSIKYFLEYQSTLKDRAGNEGLLTLVQASYFAPVVSALNLAQTINMGLDSQKRVTEYKLSVPTDDVLVWAGNQNTQSRSRAELYDVNGRLMGTGDPWTNGQPFVPRLKLWPVVAGDYRLRIVDPPSTVNEFQVQRLPDIPLLPTDRGVRGSSLKTTLYQVHLERGEQLFVKDPNGISLIAAALAPDGTVIGGIEGRSRLEASLSGTYILAIYGAAFHSSIGKIETPPVSAGPVFEGSLSGLGDRIFASLATTPGSYYLFNIETLHSDLKFSSAVTDTSRGMKVDNNQWLFAADDSEMEFSIERTRAGAEPANYKIRLTLLTGVEPLPVNTLVDSPAVGQAKYYFLQSAPEQNKLSFEGSQRFMLIQNGVLRSGDGSTTFTGLDNSGLLFRVQATTDTNQWIARSVQTIRGPLTTGTPQSLTFAHGFERYELEIDRQAVQFLSLSVASGLPTYPDIQFLNEGGRQIQPISFQYPFTWAADLSGKYRVVIAGRGPESVGQFTFQATTESDWPEITDNSIKTVLNGQRAIFRLPVGKSSYYLDALTANPTASWTVFNQTGIAGVLQSLNQSLFPPTDWDLEVRPNQINYLMADASQSQPAIPLTFRLNTTDPEVRLVTPGSAVNANLVSAGDVVRLQWNLQRGQRVQFSTLTYSSQFVKADWRPQGSNRTLPTTQPILVPVDGIYELTLKNIGTGPQPYAVTLETLPSIALGKGSTGFGIVREGSLTAFQQVSTGAIQVEANTLALFDWLSSTGNSNIRFSVRKASGQEIYSGLASDQWITFSEAGTYQFFIVNQSSTPDNYRFILRDVTTAPSIAVGQTATDTLGPFERKVVRANNAAPENLLAISGVGAMTFPISTLVGGQRESFFAAGDVVAWLDNATASTQTGSVTVKPLSSQPVLQTDKVENVVFKPGWNYFLYQPTEALTFELKSSVIGFLVTDMYGFDVSRNERFVSVPVAGKYLISFYNSANEDIATTLQLKKYVPSQDVYTLGSTVSRSLTAYEEHRYTFTLDNRAKLLFGFSGFFLRSDVELTDAQGRVVYLYDNSNSTFISSSVQELAAGAYTLRITGKSNQDYTLSIQNLSSAPTIAAGPLTGQLGTGEALRIVRINLQAGQSLALSQGPLNTAQYRIFSAADGHEPAFRSFIPATNESAGQTLWLILSGLGAKIDLKLELAEVIHMNSTVNTTLQGSLPGVQTKHMIHFAIDSPDVAFSFISGDASATLITPLGNRISIADRPFSGLVTGNYILEVSTRSSSATYRFAYTYLQNAPTVTLAGASMISSNYYRLDLTSEFNGRVVLQDGNGQIVIESALQIWRQGSITREGTGTVKLSAGTYWLRVAGNPSQPLTFQVRGLPVVGSSSSATIGQNVTLNAGDTYAVHRVEIPLSPGKAIVFGKVSVPASMSARYRIFHPLADVTETATFLQLRQNTVFFEQMAGTLQLEFEGVGAVEFQLLDLTSAPILSLDQATTGTLESSSRRVAWKLPVSSNQTFVVEQLQSSSAGVAWTIVDAVGNTVASLTPGSVWSIVSTSPQYLVASRTSALPGQSLALSVKMKPV